VELTIITIFLILPMWSLLSVSKTDTLALCLALLNTAVLPEPSIPVWLNVIHLDRISTFLLVTFVSRLPIILLFWPKYLQKIINNRRLAILVKWYTKSIGWCKSVLLRLKTFISEAVANQKEKAEANKKFLYYILPLLAVMFLFFVILAGLIKLAAIKIKKWYEDRSKKAKKIAVDLGYFGVVGGAGAPFIPLTREAGIAAVLVLNNNKAKILYNIVDVLRILAESILF